jgi:toxin secretion/phage lysis holin
MRDFSIDLVWAKIQMAVAAVGGWLGYFLGGMDGLLIALVVFMVIDYITGILCAIAEKQLSSAVGFKGICKKVLILLLVGMAHIVDLHVVGSGSMLRGAVISFYLANEGLSLVENAGRLGLPIPEKLKVVLTQLHHPQTGGDSAKNEAGSQGEQDEQDKQDEQDS